MSNPFNTKAFKALQEKWYKKAKDSGFEDAEDATNDNSPLKAWHDQYFRAEWQADRLYHHRSWALCGYSKEDR